MLVYRIEDQEGQGPFRGYDSNISHASWFRAPILPGDWNLKEVSKSGWDEKRYSYTRYRYVFGMDSLQNLLDVFHLPEWYNPDIDGSTIGVSLYEVDETYTKVVYSISGCSRQVIFDRENATLLSRHRLSLISFCGDLYDTCPPHLCR